VIHQSAYGAEPWWLRKSELNLDVLAQSESVFALSNGHIGWRANLDGTYGYFEQAPGNQRRIMSRGLASGGDRVRCGEGTEQLPGDVALERSHDLLRGAAFGSSARDVSAGGRIDAHANDGDRRERDPTGGVPLLVSTESNGPNCPTPPRKPPPASTSTPAGSTPSSPTSPHPLRVWRRSVQVPISPSVGHPAGPTAGLCRRAYSSGLPPCCDGGCGGAGR